MKIKQEMLDQIADAHDAVAALREATLYGDPVGDVLLALAQEVRELRVWVEQVESIHAPAPRFGQIVRDDDTRVNVLLPGEVHVPDHVREKYGDDMLDVLNRSPVVDDDRELFREHP